jgi:hypothetical protein
MANANSPQNVTRATAKPKKEDMGIMKFKKVDPTIRRPIYMTFTPAPKRERNLFLEGDPIIKWELPGYGNQENMEIWGEGTFIIRGNVEKLDFRQCYCITDIDLTGNKYLKEVTIGIVGCDELRIPETVEKLKVVKTHMKQIVIPENSQLQKVEFYNNQDFEAVNMGKCDNLTYFDVSFCPKLTKAVFSDCKKLKLVDMSGCKGLGTDMRITDMPDLEQVYMENCNFKTVDMSNCPQLKVVSVIGNPLEGDALDKLVATLPTIPGELDGKHALLLKKEGDNMKCTSEQMRAMKDKGWMPIKIVGRDSFPMTDSDCTGVRGLNMDNPKEDLWFNMQGQRIQKPTAKGLYIHNGKKILISQ